MRYKKTIILAIALLLVFSFSSFAKQKELKRVGTCPLLKVKPKKPITGVDQLRTLLEQYSEDVKKGFEAAGSGYLFPAFIEQVKTADIEEKVVPKGQQIKWMLFCKGKAMNDVIWAGKKTLDVYALTVKHDCKDYEIIIPKACGNVALLAERYSQPICDLKVSPEKVNISDPVTVDMSGSKCATKYEIKVYHPEGTLIATEELTAGNAQWQTSFKEPGWYFFKGVAFNADGVESDNTCEGKTYVNYPPVCDLKVTPAEGYTGKPFKLDASGSTDKDGKVAKAAFTITKDGQEVEKKDVTTDPLVWDKAFKKSGIYNVSLKVTDDFNADSENVCVGEMKVQKRFYALVEGGPMLSKGTYTGFIFGRVGFSYLLSPEKFSLVVSAGGAINLGGERFKSHFLSNVVLNAHLDTLYVGAGLGFSTKVRDDWDSGLDIVGNIGIDVISGFNTKGSIFGELRIPVRSGLAFKDAHQFLLGFRYLF
jgi:hypothetical protein